MIKTNLPPQPKHIIMRPAVLLLKSNRTFGRRRDKLLYRCLFPNGSSALVPYKAKHIGFNKHQTCKFVLVSADTDEDKDKRPICLLQSVIGDVDDLSSYYEYQLHAKGLFFAPKKLSVSNNSHLDIVTNPPSDQPIFSIDPPGCRDIDDAFSFDGKTLSIYISNVGHWLSKMGYLQHPTSIIGGQFTTIYLPGQNRPMLPRQLSDNWCSLLEGQARPVLVCLVNIETCEPTFTTTIIAVNKNWSYDDFEREAADYYHHILSIVRGMNEKCRLLTELNDSHDLIAWMMVFMSQAAAKHLDRAFFRAISTPATSSPQALPKQLCSFLTGWNSGGGHYSVTPSRHDMLGLDRYVHITSPIRRLPDLVNGLLLQLKLGLIEGNSDSAQQFSEYWLQKVGEINAQFKAVRRLQIQCSLLDKIANAPDTKTVVDGYIIECSQIVGERKEYVVYLDELNMVATYRTAENLIHLSRHTFNVYHFSNEDTFKKKVRLEKVDK